MRSAAARLAMIRILHDAAFVIFYDKQQYKTLSRPPIPVSIFISLYRWMQRERERERERERGREREGMYTASGGDRRRSMETCWPTDLGVQ